MTKIRVTKIFNFETAHALYNYDGLCKNIHGHSYKMYVTIIGSPLNDDNNVKNGMVIDFGILKKIVKTNIVDKYDHSLLVNKKANVDELKKYKQMFDRFYMLDYQPTCENMVGDFAKIIKKELPENIKLFSIRLYETATSFAEWFASDNE